MEASVTEIKAGGPTRRGFLGLLAGGAVVGVAAGYAINRGTASNNSAAADLARMTVYSTTDGEVYALRVSTGRTRWATPLFTSGWLAAGSGGVYASDYDGHVYALDAATGDIRWSRQIRGNGNAAGGTGIDYPYLSVNGGIVYIAPGTGYTYAFDAATGRLLWRHQSTSGSDYQPPVVYNGMVYVGSPDSYVYALDAVTGRFRWRSGKGGQASGAVGTGLLTIAQGILFALGANRLYAMDPISGKIQGTYPPTLPSSNGVAYIGSADGSLRATDIIKSQVLWTRRVKDAEWRPGTVAGSIVYLGIYNTALANCCITPINTNWAGAIMALDSATGKHIWTFTTPEETFGAPLVAAGIVYVVGQWNLYALDTMTGEAHWIYATSSYAGGNITISSP
jgi:eukaryotic-like serine/threonine-protein kinase